MANEDKSQDYYIAYIVEENSCALWSEVVEVRCYPNISDLGKTRIQYATSKDSYYWGVLPERLYATKLDALYKVYDNIEQEEKRLHEYRDRIQSEMESIGG